MNDISIENQTMHQQRGGAAQQQHRSSESVPVEKGNTSRNCSQNNTRETDQTLSKEKADHIAKNLNRFLKSSQTDLRVEIDRKTNTAVFKIIRKSDKKVIKQVPPEELLEIESRVRKMAGSLLDAAG